MEMKLAENIRELRLARGLSQEALSEAMYVTVQAVSKWECSGSLPELTLMVRLAEYFGVSLDRLVLGGERGVSPDSGFPDDNKLRAVYFDGERIITAHDLKNDPTFDECKVWVKFTKSQSEARLTVKVKCGMTVEGDIHGKVKAGDSISCGNITGAANAGDSLNCGNICGPAKAGDSINCGNVTGPINAGDTLNCGNIAGHAQCGERLSTGKVTGGTTCESAKVRVVEGDASCDEIVFVDSIPVW